MFSRILEKSYVFKLVAYVTPTVISNQKFFPFMKKLNLADDENKCN